MWPMFILYFCFILELDLGDMYFHGLYQNHKISSFMIFCGTIVITNDDSNYFIPFLGNYMTLTA